MRKASTHSASGDPEEMSEADLLRNWPREMLCCWVMSSGKRLSLSGLLRLAG